MNNPGSTAPSPTVSVSQGPSALVRRLRVEVRGAVQGVGFRPYIYRLATGLGLAGWVANDPRGVSIEVEGPGGAVEEFLRRLPREGPPLSAIHRVDAEWVERCSAPDSGASQFEIRGSGTHGAKSAVVLPDAATCPACLAEVVAPVDRRHGYPFTNCTHCGPRFTIVRALPYDRPNTTMADFPMCPACRAEYGDPLDRRFHAQPNACPECGPQIALWDRDGGVLVPPGKTREVLRAAAGAVRSGRILALKGLGGFQLLVDAADDEALERLRRRKGRDAKPFALMARDLEQVRRFCEVPEEAAELLESTQAPIVLLRRRELDDQEDGERIAGGVAPGNPWLGVMLPTTPLHHLLLRELAIPVVATSGNLSDEPIATDEGDALERLGALADLFLVHDRPIERHVDDSVVRIVRHAPRLLRRARGYAPMPLFLPGSDDADERAAPSVLAVGAHLKSTVALAVDGKVYLSQHLGDLETPRALDAFEQVVADFLALYEAEPAVVAHDLHPDYATTRAAAWLVAEFAERTDRSVERCPVQHHHAHLAACLAENGRLGPALGITWDGTGYGTDGTVWGGEVLVGDHASFRRVARLLPFRLPGGEAAMKEPRRAALGLLFEMGRTGDAAVLFSSDELRVLDRLLESGLNTPVTSSAGRLFDGVAALAGVAAAGSGRMTYEGQAAMALEIAAERRGVDPAEIYPLPVIRAGDRADNGDDPEWELDWRPLVHRVVEDAAAGAGSGAIGARFHAALAMAIVEVARRVGEPTVALTGGCFQNRLLTEWAADALEAEGFEVLLHRAVPANDGGIAFGQAAVATARRKKEGSDRCTQQS